MNKDKNVKSKKTVVVENRGFPIIFRIGPTLEK